MGQFFDEDKIKAMEAAAESGSQPSATPAQPATPSNPPAAAPKPSSGGGFYDQAKIDAMAGSTSSSSSRAQSLGTYVLIALVGIAVLGLLYWKITHNPATMIVNINKASATELSYLPGVGEAKAKVIIDHRPYTSIEDLKKVPGIGEKTFEKMKPRVKVE